MNERTYYAMKSRLGGEKMTVRDKLCFHWRPTPGCKGHAEIIGKRRAKILFNKYCFTFSRNDSLRNKSTLIYWRSHPKEWNEILAMVYGK